MQFTNWPTARGKLKQWNSWVKGNCISLHISLPNLTGRLDWTARWINPRHFFLDLMKYETKVTRIFLGQWVSDNYACRDSVTTPVCQHFVQTYRDSCKWPEMKTSCPLTCKFCVPPPRCATKASRYGCCWDKKTEAKSYAGDGCPECRDQFPSYCRERIARHPRKSACNKHGSKMCPKSCGVCEHKAAAAQAPPECLYSHYGCCWDLTSAQGPVGEGCVACRDRHGFKRLCKLWSHYCKDEAYKYVQKNVIDEYRETCPMTCGKCRIGQKMLDLSVYKRNWYYMMSLRSRWRPAKKADWRQ